MRGCWYELFGGDPDDFPTELENRREEVLNQPLLGEESLLVQRSNTYQSLSSDDSPAHPTHLPLYLPGRILHITEDGPARRSAHTDENNIIQCIRQDRLLDKIADVLYKHL